MKIKTIIFTSPYCHFYTAYHPICMLRLELYTIPISLMFELLSIVYCLQM